MGDFGETYQKTLHDLASQEIHRLSASQSKFDFKRTMKTYHDSFAQQGAEGIGWNGEVNAQVRVNDNYLPPQYSLSDNFLHQTFLSDAKSFVQYQKLIGFPVNPADVEALSQLPPELKTHVRPHPSIEFRPEDNPQAFARFKSPYQQEQGVPLKHQAIFDNDGSLFSRNVLGLTDNTLPLKSYIDMLGGIEDTVATMEGTLKSSELKNLEEKYVNYYVPNYIPAPPPQGDVPPPANPFDRKPWEQNNVQLHQAQPGTYQEGQSNYENTTNQHHKTEIPKKSQINPILEQSRKLRQDRERNLYSLK